jgi:hypothetical protein
MILNESVNQFKNIIKEEYNVTDERRANWMAKLAQFHSIYESKKGVQLNEGIQNNGNVAAGIYTTPLNTMGMGNIMAPHGFQNTGTQVDQFTLRGSGDVPMSTLTASLEIAAVTIGFDLVPVVQATGPWAFLSFNDFPYAGGKLGRINETVFDGKGEGDENKPIYIKVSGDMDVMSEIAKAAKESGVQYPAISIESENGTIEALYLGNSRIDNGIIVKINSVMKDEENVSIASIFRTNGEVTATIEDEEFTLNVTTTTTDAEGNETNTYAPVRPELVKGVSDHIQSFSNFYGDGNGNPSDDTMSRAENETGVGNTIGARIFTKQVQMGSYEVTGSVTRQQLQDMPLYGVDVIGGVLEAMQNEISQAINNRILDRVFKHGVENYKIQKAYQNVDLNLYIAGANAPATKDLNTFSAFNKFRGLDGKTVKNTTVSNATQNTSAENVTTHQRRIMTRCLAASNLIASVSRRGRGEWMVTNTAILTALQDCSQFVYAPMRNTMIQGGNESLYMAGELAGMQVYVDPFMTWEDTRICVGRRATVTNNKVNGSGVVFMPYILADQVQIIAEGTMAPKMLMNSRFAIVDCGFYPEQNYYTFMVDVADGMIL